MQTKYAKWVAYRVTKDTPYPNRPRNWKTDPDIPAGETLDDADYKLLSHTAGLSYVQSEEFGTLYHRLGTSDGMDLVDFDLTTVRDVVHQR